jgi:1-acyl-sn-glycerol-3-phosphate acyltransferase
MDRAAALRTPPFYRFSSWCVRLLLPLFTRHRIIGAARMPHSGPVLVVSNHVSNVDPLILIGVLPRTVRFMTKQELFSGPIAPLTRALGSFSVRRGQSDREAIRIALELLRHGACVGIFPEGTRSRNGVLADGKPGVGLIALRSEATVVPVGLVGTGRLQNLRSLFARPEIDIIIGEPLRLPRLAHGGRSAAEATRMMMCQIAELLPVEMRGVYGVQRVMAAEQIGPT